MRKSSKNCSLSRKVFLIFNAIFTIFLILAIVVPLIKTVSSAVSNTNPVGLELIPKKIDLTAFKTAFNENFGYGLLISALVTLISTIIGLLFSAIGAYILTQKDMPGIRLFRYLVLFALAFDAGIAPKFVIIYKLGLYNSIWSIILSLSLNICNMLILYHCFRKLPKNVLEAAEIDGCTPVGKFFKVVLPMSKPYLAAVGFLFASSSWNEYLYYLMYIGDYLKYGFQYWVRDNFALKDHRPWNGVINTDTMVCVTAIIAAIPVLLLALRFFKDIKATAEQLVKDEMTAER